MKELLFGAAYYPEYMPYERIEKDIQMMKEARMNVVRIAESTWSTLEPEEGMYDFSYIDKVLEVTKREGVSVIIGTPTYAIPTWLVKKEPNVMVRSRKGQADYGHRQLMDITNPVFLAHAERVIRKLIEHVVEEKHVIGFQIDNETKHYDTMSLYAQELFLEHLKVKFVTPEAMNRAFGLNYWSNSIHRWDDMPDMKGCVNASLVGEFEKFKRTLAANYLEWQSNIIKEYKREEQFITHNFDFEWKKFGAEIAQDGYSYGVQPDINHYEASRCLTLTGTDIYHPTQEQLTGAEIAFGGDSIRSLKYENYLVLECQAQAFKYWTPYPGQLRQQAYSHIASGATGILYWNWHSIHNGYETYWKGLLSHDLDSNPAYEEAIKVGKEWKIIGKDVLEIKKHNRIALVIDNISLTAFQWFPIDKELSYNDVVRWIYDSLYELNIECDVVDVNGLKTSQYNMIITPALYCVREEIIDELKEFVMNGGVLVSTFKSFVCNEDSTVYCDRQPHNMTDCFGMSYNQFTDPGYTKIDGRNIKYFMELLTVSSAQVVAFYEHKYWGDYAGITKNCFGKGKAYYIGCYTEKERIKEILLEAIQEAGIQTSENEFPIITKKGINRKNEKIYYVFNYSIEEQEIVCSYEHVQDILTKKYYKQGDKILIKDWGVLILKQID